MYQFKVYSISTFDGESNIVCVVHDRDLVISELNILRDESPGFDWLSNEVDLKEDLMFEDSPDSICGCSWEDGNRFVNVTVHGISFSAKIENVLNEL